MVVELTVVGATRGGAAVDVAVRAPSGTPLARVREQLLAAVGAPSDAVLLAGGEVVDGAAVVGRPPLVRGAVVSAVARGAVRAAARPAADRVHRLQLHVVGGPDAGAVVPLVPGRVSVGRGRAAHVRVQDPGVSRVHLELDVTDGGVRVRDAGSANGTAVDGAAVDDEVGTPDGAGRVLRAGARIGLGSSALVLRAPVRRAATALTGDGGVAVNRRPRSTSSPAPVVLRLPRPPRPPGPLRLSLLAMLLPLVVAVPVAVLWSPFALLFALGGPVLTLGTALGERRTARREHARERAEHERRSGQVRARAADLVAQELADLEHGHPDPAALLATATGPGERLWERTPGDRDHLALRLGTGALASGVEVVAPAAHGEDDERERLVHARAPVVVPLARTGVLGACGPRRAGLGLLRGLLGQVAVLHSPREVRLVVLCAAPEPVWGWLRWLPHAQGPVAAGAEEVRGRVAALLRELDARAAARAPGAAGALGPNVVVVLDGARSLRAVPGVARLLSEGPALGIVVVCWEDDAARLPLECSATVELRGPDGHDLVLSSRAGERTGAVADLVGAAWAERVARSLAPLRDATPEQEGSGVPDQVRLLDLLGTGATDAAGVRRGWQRGPRSTSVVLGARAGGPWVVDLRRDGPHLLVAGTTGAGKSELLQCLVASLAAANRPEELALVLVDYKGGAAFAEVADLPHAVGLVTDLDRHLTRRALASLEAEVGRRERLLRQHGCRDHEQYSALRDAGAVHEPLPRLVLVVDEFRVLAEELPDFLGGLVRLAAVGRSLGVHLVLATQRPAGVVSAEIRANTNLRIALRVREEADSVDVVESRAAARISARHPGRAVARTGGGPLVEVQTARVSGTAPVEDETVAVTAVRSAPASQRAPAPAPPRAAAGPSDLLRIVEAVSAAGRDLPRAAPPWLPPLPDVLALADLPPLPERAPDTAASTEVPGAEVPGAEVPGTEVPGTEVPGAEVPGASPRIALGRLDDPAAQAQPVLVWSPAAGPLLVAGGPRTGRTSTLRALAAGAAQHSPERVHLHALAAPGSGLEELAGLPHAGAVVGLDDGERCARLVRVLAAEVARRQACGPGSAAAPWVVLLVDGTDRLAAEAALLDADAEAILEGLRRLVVEGPSVGVVPVLAGDRALLTGRLAAAVSQRLVLAMPDPADYVVAGAASREVPERMPPGRALRLGADGAREAQVALLVPDPSPSAQRRALHDVVARARTRWAHVPAPCLPPAVPVVPARLTASALAEAVRADPGALAPGAVPVGLGGERVRPVGLDLRNAPVAVVAGPAGSGRSSVLCALAERVAARGGRVVALAPRSSPLSALARRPGCVVLGAADAAGLERALRDAVAPSAGTGGVVGGVVGGVLVLVDDAELVAGTAVEPVLLELLASSREAARAALVLAGTTADLAAQFRGVVPEARRWRTGLLLHPLGLADGDLLGVRLPRTPPGPPGRATAVHRGAVTAVQLALPDGGAAVPHPRRTSPAADDGHHDPRAVPGPVEDEDAHRHGEPRAVLADLVDVLDDVLDDVAARVAPEGEHQAFEAREPARAHPVQLPDGPVQLAGGDGGGALGQGAPRGLAGGGGGAGRWSEQDHRQGEEGHQCRG
ncbi:FtsK/SpoIIIE domain-containing protein [Quadrisphaera sp. DSM 44207]|uniref:FtsK/SpoIIIE domain-containing protein n=1 Tax=Quadrisphaera sp. DSM 44207 TaxID=1881057 RepID=UPI0008871671|nr:FtsK/SpoIIIE domain-containing protein [Quadrisphaera sp. DSM 44207]SDQ08558.1 DNA segregation ATPase FtsK/SpoIIIE, S-DNA-T family [Quadrisphaera sp. DSM 44207]